MSFFRGLGRRLRELGRDVGDFFVGRIGDLFRDELPDTLAEAFRKALDVDVNVDGAIRTVTTRAGLDPELAGALIRALDYYPPWLRPLLAVVMLPGLMGVAIDLATTKMRVDAQSEASLAWVPKQVEADVKARLPWVPDQAQAQLAAQIPLMPQEMRGRLAATMEVRPQGIAPMVLGEAVHKGYISEERAEELSARAGYPSGLVGVFRDLARQLLTADVYTRALFRRLIDEESYRDRLHKLGLKDEDIELLKEVSKFYPPPSDLVTWQAREVYEPDSIRKYGLDEELERLEREPFYRAGVDDEQIRNYWIAHWEHPSFIQIAEMLRRDILIDPRDRDRIRPGSDEWRRLRAAEHDEVYEWYRLVEIPPYWRDKLTRMLYEPFTRVDVRRMWDLGVASDDDVLRNMLDLGYDEDHARKYLLWVKVYQRAPDLIARYRNGWISEGDVLAELIRLGMDERQAREFLQTKVKAPHQPARVQRERDLTKSEIIKGIKKGIITREQGKELLMRMGYDEWEAEYIIVINVGWGESPETYYDYLEGVELARKAQGLPAVPIPADLKALAEEERRLRERLEEARRKGKGQQEIDRLEAELAQLRYRLSQRAQALKSSPSEE